MSVYTYVHDSVEGVNEGIDYFALLTPWGDSSKEIHDQYAALRLSQIYLSSCLRTTLQESEKTRPELLKRELCKERVKLVVRITCWVIAGIMAIAAFAFAFIYLLGVIPSGGVALAVGAGLGALLAAAVAGAPVFGVSFLLNIDCKSKSLKKECEEKKQTIELALEQYRILSKKADQKINNVDEITALFGQFNSTNTYKTSGLTEMEVKSMFMKAMKKVRFEDFHEDKVMEPLPDKVNVIVTPFLNRVFIDRMGSKAFGLAGGIEIKDLDTLFAKQKA